MIAIFILCNAVNKAFYCMCESALYLLCVSWPSHDFWLICSKSAILPLYMVLHLPSLMLVIYFLRFHAPSLHRDWLKLCPNQNLCHTWLRSWTSLTRSRLVWLETHLAAFPSHRHAQHCGHTRIAQHAHAWKKLRGLQYSHARLFSWDKPLFHSLTHSHRYTCKYLASYVGVV